MKYKVHARSWNEELSSRFGERNVVHELTDTEVVEAIVTFGRAEIIYEDEGILSLEFQNDYD